MDDDTTPVPAWKRKPKAWLSRKNLLTCAVVVLLSICVLVAGLWHWRHHAQKGTCFPLFVSSHSFSQPREKGRTMRSLFIFQ
jgi:hypothetical protein